MSGTVISLKPNNNRMRFLMFAVFLFLSTVDVLLAEPKCHTIEAMSCLDYPKDFLNSLPRSSLPETSEEVEGFCTAVGDALTCWEGFKSQCMTPIQRELESLILEGIKTFRNDFCSAGSTRKSKYMEHATCLNKIATNDNTKGSLNYFLAILDTMLAKPEEGSVAYVCCGFNKIYNEIKDDSMSTCGAEATSFGEDVISSIISTLPSAICGGFEPESNECQKVKLADGTKPAGLAKDSKIYKFVTDFLQNFIPE